MIRKAIPAAKLTMLRNAIRIRKPARLSERCGVSIAENNVGGSSYGLLGVIGGQYSLNMAGKTALKSRTKSVAKKSPAKKTIAKTTAASKPARGRKAGVKKAP